MRIPPRVLAPFVVLAFLSGIFFAGLIRVNMQSSMHPTKPNEIRDKSDDFLLVSIEANRQSSSVDEIRRSRNEKYDGWGWVRKSVTPEASTVTMNNDWQINMPALPVTKSDAVVVGVVDAGKAYFSADEGGIYSEFAIKVSEWLKRPTSFTDEVSEDIVVQRAGGRVLYPSGTVVRYSISGQEMPRLNGRYVFFLTYDQRRLAFMILTAYGMSEGIVFPLDGKGKSRIGGFRFNEYEGTSEKVFLRAVAEELQREKQNPSEANAQ